MINHLLILSGMVLVGISSFLFEHGRIDAPTWMILLGFGLYLGYIPFNSILFDRLIAAFQYVSTVGFLIYLADAFGYLGSIGIMIYKEFGQASLSWLHFFIKAGYVMAIVGSLLIIGSMIYFYWKHRNWKMQDRKLSFSDS